MEKDTASGSAPCGKCRAGDNGEVLRNTTYVIDFKEIVFLVVAD